MIKFKLIKRKDESNEFDTTNVRIDVETVLLDELVVAMEEFIRACGFYPKGRLGWVPLEDEDEIE